MTARTHRVLAMLAVGLAGLGGLVALTDPTGLGVSPTTWGLVGNWLSLIAGIVGVGITMVRSLTDTAP